MDTRTGETLASGTGVSQGGSVETFDSEADAKARAKNIQTLLKATQILGSEYNYVSPGGVLVRISGKLTPDEADAYGKAAGATLYKA